MLDTTGLTPTSSKQKLPWREPALTFLWLRADGPIVSAYKIEDKLDVVASCGPDDHVLALRQVQFPRRQEVMVVDDLEQARRALTGDE